MSVEGNYKILIVDDSSVMRKGIISLMREKIEAEYREAENGEAGVKLFLEFNPDLVTMDINMPGIDGMEALKQIIGHDRKAKVIMLTTEAEKGKIIEAVSMGAKSYIVKPITDKAKALDKIMNALSL